MHVEIVECLIKRISNIEEKIRAHGKTIIDNIAEQKYSRLPELIDDMGK